MLRPRRYAGDLMPELMSEHQVIFCLLGISAEEIFPPPAEVLSPEDDLIDPTEADGGMFPALPADQPSCLKVYRMISIR